MAAAPTSAAERHPLHMPIYGLVAVAMLIFAYTIIVGILNGLDLVDFSRRLLLAHLHGGTLGWMTLGIMAATLWLFADRASNPGQGALQAAKVLAVIAAVAIAAYVIAFATTFGVARPVTGVVTLVALVGFAGWAISRARAVTLTVPRLLALVGLGTSVLGGVFGVINGFAIARGWDWVPDSFFDAHPATMEVGFVIPVAMGLAEWSLRRGEPDQRATRAGWAQVGLMFVAFSWVLVFTLAEVDDLIGPGITFGIAGLIVFYVRMWPFARRVSLMERGPNRHCLAAGVFLGAAIVYIFVIIQMAEGDFDAIPRGQLLSFIHLMAVGGTTNALLAFVFHLSRKGGDGSIFDDIVFWGIAIGVTGFVIALSSGIDGLIHLFVPLMGVALVIALLVHGPGIARGLTQRDDESPTAVREPA
jgi:hypothetical protein